MRTFILLGLCTLMSVLRPCVCLRFDAEDAKNRPVSKVINLLKDMAKQLEKEGEEDEEIYKKMGCWCKTNDREKTKSIADAEAHIKDLTSQIESLSAASARLGSEITNTEKEVAENQNALEKATSLREKQLAEFNAEEKDLLESVSALKAAVTVLSKHNSFLQLSRGDRQHIVGTLQNAMQTQDSTLKSVLTPSQLISTSKAIALLQQEPDYINAEPTFKQSYAPQSGEIFGILTQMLETFQANLKTSQQEEQENSKAYEDLKKAKEDEIAAGLAQIEKKTEEKADTDEKHAQAKTDKKDTTASLSADEQFLMKLKEKCQLTDKEFEERTKTRQLEIQAVSKALEILSNDDAHDTFTKTFNFIQTSSRHSGRSAAAARILNKLANKFDSPRLSALAMRAKLDAFERVKEEIDKLHAQLEKTKADEVKQKDFCTDEFHQNELETEKKERTKEDVLALIQDLENQIKTLDQSIKKLKGEISEMQVQLKRAGEDREKENKEFQATVADQRATQQMLKAALNVLQDFYDKHGGSFVQSVAEPVGPPPPAGFKEYKKNKASGGVMGMIKQIAQDAKALENEAIRSEEDAQKAYEDFVKETNGSIEAKSKAIMNNEDTKSKREAELVEAQKKKEATLLELEQLSTYKAELHSNCDFLIKNFDLRQEALQEEMDGLMKVKATLSGSDATA